MILSRLLISKVLRLEISILANLVEELIYVLEILQLKILILLLQEVLESRMIVLPEILVLKIFILVTYLWLSPPI